MGPRQFPTTRTVIFILPVPLLSSSCPGLLPAACFLLIAGPFLHDLPFLRYPGMLIAYLPNDPNAPAT